VQLHGGTVAVTSAPGHGSTFVITLPFGTDHLPHDRLGRQADRPSGALHARTYVEEALRWLPEASSTHHGVNQRPGKGGRVLVADDNTDMRDYLRRLLCAEYEVATVANGQEALTAALESPPDLVLSDVMMPVLDGFALLRGLRSHPETRAVPVILLSARAGEEASIEGLDAGADDYLAKPFTARQLLARVGAHLALKRERQRAHERLTQVFSQAPVAIAVLRGREMVVELANQPFREMLQGRELIGRRLSDAAPEMGSEVWNTLRRVVDTGDPFVATELYMPCNENRDRFPEDHWFNVVHHPLREQDGTTSGVVTVWSDVTVQVRARQELERINRELEEFAYVVSHDLQEPLRTVNIYTQQILRRLPEMNADLVMFADYVQQGVDRMMAIIRDLLAYSRTVRSDEVPEGLADLTSSLSEAMAVLRTEIEGTGAVITSSPLPMVRGDTTQFAHVFQNLLSNALKYRKNATPPEIHIAASADGRQWNISVRDNGIGFEQKYAERIFGLFKRLHKHEYPGTGLGLSICQRVVERYGGRMWAEAQPGNGATFCFSVAGCEVTGRSHDGSTATGTTTAE
jgi:signal transduction histidine kinase